MRRSVLAVLALTVLLSPGSLFADSYLFVTDGRAITNGEPVNVKALKARYSGSYFWFSIGGKAYLVRDPNVLKRMKPIYDPLFSGGGGFPIGEQFTVLSQQMTLLQEQLRIGLEPKPGEDARIAARRVELKFEQNRLARRQNELAEQANAAARAANDFAARLGDINREIERQLRVLGVQLIGQKIAVPADSAR